MLDSVFVGGYWLVGALMANGAFLFLRIRWMLIAWCGFLVTFMLLGIALESKYGAIKEKSLSFYVILALVFTLLGFPGYVIRFLKKG